MKKLAIAIVSLAFAATPVLACPGHEDEVKTTEKEKAPPKTAEQPKEKQAPAKDTQKPADNKTAKPADPKKPDKVSSK